MPYRLQELADVLARAGMPAALDGPTELAIHNVNTLDDAGPGDIGFLANARYEKALQTTRAGAVLVTPKQAVPAGVAAVRVADPYAAVTALMVHMYGHRRHPGGGIDPRSVIDPSAAIGEGANVHHHVTIAADVTIGRNVVVYPGCYVARGCRLGDDCVLFPNVVVYEGCVLGDRVTIHAGSVIGEDGLGYAPVKEKWHKIPQIGVVEIGDDVEIGANCTIDRATLGRTVIGPGSKFSNLIAIGHGTRIGRDCMFVAQVGVAGSVTIGNHVTMAGKAGVAGHLQIGDNAQLAAMAGVMHDVPANTRVMGAPATEMREASRSMALVMKLPEMRDQIKELRGQIKLLEARVAELTKTGAARR